MTSFDVGTKQQMVLHKMGHPIHHVMNSPMGRQGFPSLEIARLFDAFQMHKNPHTKNQAQLGARADPDWILFWPPLKRRRGHLLDMIFMEESSMEPARFVEGNSQ